MSVPQKMAVLENVGIGVGLQRFHCIHSITFVSLCGGELRVDQRKKYANICDVAQVTDIHTLPN